MNWAVVPFEHHASEVGVINFLRDFVVLFESLAKMIQVGITNVLDGKVIDNESANMTGHHLWRQSPGVVATL